MNSDLLLTTATSAILISWWKMMLMFLPFLPWAWLISSKLDKDARFFHLNYHMWNGLHLGAGLAALAAMLFIPFFWFSWPAGLLILAAPILVYWKVRNQKVPEARRFQLSGEGLSSKLAARRQARATRAAVLQFVDAAGRERKVPLKDDPLYETHLLAEDVIGQATASRASRVELEVEPNRTTLVQTIDGIRYKRPPVAPDAAVGLIDYLKGFANLEIKDRRRRQSGTFRMHGPGGEVELTLTTAGSSTGQVARIEIDRSKQMLRPFDALGFLPSQIEALRVFEAAHDRHGIILIGAPSGHGLSTSMYSFVARHDAYTSNVKTLEREIQVRIDGVDHVQWDPGNPDVDFATNLQSILRRDPDLVMLGQVMDKETARVAVAPGMQGPLIYVPQRSATIADQIRRWVKVVGDVKDASRALRAVVNQRLLRTLCQNCRQSYQPTADQLRKLNIAADKIRQLYRAGGKIQIKNKIENCPVCAGSGYLGQTAAFEVLQIDDESRRLLMAGDLKGVLALARRQKMVYLQEAALSKVISGEISVEEVVRVTAPAPKQRVQGGGTAHRPAEPNPAATP